MLPAAVLLGLVLLPSGLEPFPLRRVPLAADALPPANGPWHVLTGEEFERRLRAAAEPPTAPRIVSQTMSARFADGALLGDGVWSFAGEGLFKLDPFSLAVRDWKWDDAQSVIASKTVNEAITLRIRSRLLNLNWSLQGREEPGAVRFDWHLPTAALSSLVLDVPAGRNVAAKDALVTGPAPSPVKDHARFRIVTGGRPKVEIVVRSAAASPAIQRGSRSVRYDITATGIAAQFDFDLESLRGPAATWTFALDPGVQVLNVATPQQDAWHVDGGTLTVTGRDAVAAQHVTVQASLPFPAAGTPWACSGVSTVGAAGPDRIECRVAADVKLEAWEPADYVLTHTAPAPGRSMAFHFRSGWRHDAVKAIRMPPTFRMRAGSAEVTVRETLRWTRSDSQNHATDILRMTVVRGPVPVLAAKLPAGYQVSSVRTTPDDPALTWTAAGTNLTVEPSRPWSTGNVIDVKVDLVKGPLGLDVTALPRITLPIASATTGTLTVTLAGSLTGTLTTPAGVKTGTTLTAPLAATEPEPVLTLSSGFVGPSTPTGRAPVAADEEPSAQFEDIRVRNVIDAGGRIRCKVTGFVTGNGKRFNLSASRCELIGCRVNGRWIESSLTDGFLRLAFPAGLRQPFELELVAPYPSRFLGRLPNPAPLFPGAAPGQVEWQSEGSPRFSTDLETTYGATLVYVIDVRLLVAAAVAVGLLFLWAAWALPWRRARRGAALAIILLAPALATTADEPATVYVRPDGRVLVPAAVLERLDALTASRDTIITAATITALEADGVLDCEAALAVDAAAKPLVLPLRNATIASVTVDGEAALPVAVNDRFTLAMKQPGPHTVVVHWRQAVTVRGADRTAEWAFENVPRTVLNINLPATARSLDVSPRRGALTTARVDGRVRATADLGDADQIRLRWRGGGIIGVTAQTARVTGRQLTLWDLSAPESAVLAAFDLTVDGGSVTRLTFDVPPGLAAGRLTLRTAAGATVPVRDWRVAGDTVTVLLQEPFEGRGTAVLRLEPIAPGSLTPTLASVRLRGATVSETLLAVRTGPTAVIRWDRGTAAETTADAIPREFLAIPEIQLDRTPPAKVYRLDAAAVVKAILETSTPPNPKREEITWRLGAKAEATGVMTFDGDAHIAVEFDLPAAVSVTALTAPELAGWQRSGAKVRVWFRTPQKDAVVRFRGTWGAYPQKTASVDLPGFSKPGRVVRVTGVDDVRVQIPPQRGWQPGVSLRPGTAAMVATQAGAPLKVNVTKP